MVEPLPQAEPAGRVFPPDPTAPAEESYRSLSVLALLGFGLAALYAAIVLYMGAFALFSGKPLLLSGWTLLMPLAALAMCLLAGFQIRRSEGTLAGGALASWGWKLSLFVGLGYSAYYAAVYFAVRQQAEAFARDWLELLARGDLEKAAFRTLPPLRRYNLREDDPDLGRIIDMRSGGGRDPSGASSFLQTMRGQPFVRLLLQSGSGVEIEAQGVQAWSFEKGGYAVSVAFHIKTPEVEFPAVVTVHGSEAPNKEYEGRWWNVDIDRTNWVENEAKATELGRHLSQATQDALEFLRLWVGKLREDKIAAFADTLPPEQRPQAVRTLKVSRVLLLPPDPSLWDRFRRFVAGEMVRADEKTRLSPADRETAVAAARRRFEQRNEPVAAFAPRPRSMPERQRDGNALTLGFDHQFGDDRGLMMIVLVLEVTGDAGLLDGKAVKPNWRVSGVRVVSVIRGEQRPAPGGPPDGAPGGPPSGGPP
jgi:hypothetical protein